MRTTSDIRRDTSPLISTPHLGQVTVHSDRVFSEYSFDPIAMRAPAYDALSAGDFERFSRPLATGIVRPTLAEIRRALGERGPNCRARATKFVLKGDHLVVTGQLEHLQGAGDPISDAGFSHDWWFMYSVPYKFEQHISQAA